MRPVTIILAGVLAYIGWRAYSLYSAEKFEREVMDTRQMATFMRGIGGRR